MIDADLRDAAIAAAKEELAEAQQILNWAKQETAC